MARFNVSLVDEEKSTQDELRAPDARTVWEMLSEQLEKANIAISNHDDPEWQETRRERLVAKRDSVEEMVRVQRKICEDLGLLKFEQLDLPGVDTPRNKPRPRNTRE